jgi:Xaa-Pro aminopeptidase
MLWSKLVVRDEIIRHELERTNWDLMVCSMPSNVLLLTGYWPATGYSVAVATREGQIILIVPEDEDDVAEHCWADEIVTYCPAPLDRLTTAEEAVLEAFAASKARLGILADRIGFEQAEAFEPAAYAPNLFRGSSVRILRRVFPSATLAPADELLAEMRAVKTAAEIEHIRTTCKIAESAFAQGARVLRTGITEPVAAAAFRAGLASCLADHAGVKRCDGFTYCMSGPNSAHASAPYSRSRSRQIASGDFVVLRCHCYADGYWADVTRTYHVGPVDATERAILDALFRVRDAVWKALRPGAKGVELDDLARSVAEAHGLGDCMKHPIGHGAGFTALDHTARPRLHPKSGDVLQPGMIVKIEPGLYREDFGGVRTADMVAITESGYELLTPFHQELCDLAVGLAS